MRVGREVCNESYNTGKVVAGVVFPFFVFNIAAKNFAADDQDVLRLLCVTTSKTSLGSGHAVLDCGAVPHAEQSLGIGHVHLDLVVAERTPHLSVVPMLLVVLDVVGVLARNVCGFGIGLAAPAVQEAVDAFIEVLLPERKRVALWVATCLP